MHNIRKYIRLLDVLVSHQTISAWIEKYVYLMQLLVERLKPNVCNSWSNPPPQGIYQYNQRCGISICLVLSVTLL